MIRRQSPGGATNHETLSHRIFAKLFPVNGPIVARQIIF
jgi:hypothetical protein